MPTTQTRVIRFDQMYQ